MTKITNVPIGDRQPVWGSCSSVKSVAADLAHHR